MIRRLAHTTILATLCIGVGVSAGVAAAGEPATRDLARQVINLDSDTVVIYEDGRVYRRADLSYWYTPAGYAGSVRLAPPPPPGAFEWAVLSPEAVDELLGLVDEFGFDDDDLDFGVPLITDSPTSTLVAVIDGVQVEHSVYAPDFSDGLTPDQQRLRDDYEKLRAVLFDLEGEFGAELSDFEPYVPKQWVVDARRYRFQLADRPWPLGTPPVDGDCVVLPSDADVDTATGAYLYDGDTVGADATLPNDPRCAPVVNEPN